MGTRNSGTLDQSRHIVHGVVSEIVGLPQVVASDNGTVVGRDDLGVVPGFRRLFAASDENRITDGADLLPVIELDRRSEPVLQVVVRDDRKEWNADHDPYRRTPARRGQPFEAF